MSEKLKYGLLAGCIAVGAVLTVWIGWSVIDTILHNTGGTVSGANIFRLIYG